METTQSARTPLTIAPGAVRMRPGQLFWWTDSTIWRRGPDTPDGFWMIAKITRRAVRIIEDDRVPERTAEEFEQVLFDALNADKIDAEDTYLAALTTAAEILPEELVRLRDAVRAGRRGGASDGASPRQPD